MVEELDVPFDPSGIKSVIAAVGKIGKPQEALALFHDRHKDDHLLLNNWFAFNAVRPAENAAGHVRALARHAAFTLSNPNRVRSLVGTFIFGNPVGFNAPSGEGYRLAADIILDLDPINQSVAARLATGFGSWRGLEKKRRTLAEAALKRMLAAPKLSRDSFEIISKTLG